MLVFHLVEHTDDIGNKGVHINSLFLILRKILLFHLVLITRTTAHMPINDSIDKHEFFLHFSYFVNLIRVEAIVYTLDFLKWVLYALEHGFGGEVEVFEEVGGGELGDFVVLPLGVGAVDEGPVVGVCAGLEFVVHFVLLVNS